MLKVRVIPTLLWKGFGLVKGVAFNSWRRVGSVLPALKVYNSRDVDELALMDITATFEERAPDRDSVSDFADECFVPLTVGGGIVELAQIAGLLRAGADKISLNSGAIDRPELIDEAAATFGSQCVVVSIDVRSIDDRYEVFSRCGTVATGRDPLAWAKECERRGAGEILLTSIDRDGTLQGYDLKLVEMVSRAVDIPVIASGGCGEYRHMVDAVKQAGASAVAAASMFHFTEQTPAGAKRALHAAGVPVRQNVPAD